MKKFILIAALLLSACDCDAACQQQTAAEDAIYCKPELVATAPDGTELWRVSHHCSKITSSYDVYFSKTGTQTEEFCGKGCYRTVITPNSH